MAKGGAPAAVDTAAQAAPKAQQPAKPAKPAQTPQAKQAPGKAAQGDQAQKSQKTQSWKSQDTAKPAKPAAADRNGSGGSYTVKSGDTLSDIAAKFSTDTASLHAKNVKAIGGNPDLIFPGQTLSV
ncbi:LysM peptidoglycan-binding domain-containing protein [Kitasatospora sp. NBC_01246]